MISRLVDLAFDLWGTPRCDGLSCKYCVLAIHHRGMWGVIKRTACVFYECSRSRVGCNYCDDYLLYQLCPTDSSLQIDLL